ncbi:MAG: glycosyltransferase family 39 protein [Desulfurococcales archaeon]|nr:glycosyltransferase family 39 protein [Desulfurococcales archaeon]
MDLELRGGSRTAGRKDVLSKAVPILLLALLLTAFTIYEWRYVSGIEDYISDECWYVSAARNVLDTYFHVTPHGPCEGYVMATVELEQPSTASQYAEWINQIDNFLHRYGGKIVKGDTYYTFKEGGNFLPAVCVEVPPQHIKELSEVPHGVKYKEGYCYPNAAGILTYMNQEHPPLVKYFIALSMWVLGDYPTAWRIPSLIAGVLILALTYLAFKAILRDEVYAGFLGVAAALLTVLDPTFRALSAVAMLDIFVALFTYMTYFFTLHSKLLPASISLGLGFVSKFSGGFPGVPALIEFLRRCRVPAKVLLTLIYVPVLTFFAISIPFMIHDGFWGWWASSVTGAIKWHLSKKTTGGPPQAMPWEWLIGRNSFTLHYTYNSDLGRWVPDLIASGDPILYILLLALSIYVIPHIRRMPDRGVSFNFAWGTYLMYFIIYALGAKTQYSFYSVQVVPLFYTLLVLEIYYLLRDPKVFLDVARDWWRLIKTFFDWLAGLVKIRVRFEVIPTPS